MKIIDAFWEKENTGLKVCEVVFENTDQYDAFPGAKIEASYDYCVAKVPVGELGLVHLLENDGFRFLESQLNIILETQQAHEVFERYHTRFDGFSCCLVEERDDIDSIKAQVGRGMFKADRFSLDPFWEDVISSKRYCNWIETLFLEQSCKFYILKRKEEAIGFFALKTETTGRGACPIAGIYNDFQGKGYLLGLAYFWLSIGNEMGLKRLSTTISGNNIPMQSFFSKIISFRIDSAYVVLRKVCKR